MRGLEIQVFEFLSKPDDFPVAFCFHLRCIRAGACPARPSALAVAPSGLYSPFKPTFSTDLQNPIHNMVFPTNKKERGMKGGPVDSIEFDPEKDRLFEAVTET